ncbi:hypothetical protein D3218_07615 [Aureimonas flava]|uniref:Uncharacterized protein n=1 Tax=Aureimonas flava TaxID=2320271 RepID=A0A3A1WMR3_9HYPH|nr:hypothetical protein [Aureimonas flava]RIY02151.1 hypothetical protein D3218_07615 [Aureimonas flava]
MSRIAPTPPDFSLARKPLSARTFLKHVDRDWSATDWVIALSSVTLAVASAGFFSWSYAVSLETPDYFQQAALARMSPKLDPIETGSVGEAAHADAMPAPTIVRDHTPTPSDYQIVMIFQDEALLATRQELMRVKVGSVVPGLGTVQAIEGGTSGGSVTAEKATLRSIATPDP